MFNSTSWTGRGAETATIEQPAEQLETAPKTIKPRVDRAIMPETTIAEYREVAKQIGVSDQDIMVEDFRLFLSKHDIPSFNLQEVISYMDEIAAKDNPTGFGWHWCPVRPKDAKIAMTFGRPSQYKGGDFHNRQGERVPGSDFYESHQFQSWHSGRGGFIQSGWTSSSSDKTTVNVESNVRVMQAAHDEMFQTPPTPRDWRKEPSPAYTRTLPLHALKKIALVEKHFTAGPVVFLVSDYTTSPRVVINPDPFLMAVIPNSAVAHGKGRFIIDIWDEPGFGIERMLK
jgi:hypothetical protein